MVFSCHIVMLKQLFIISGEVLHQFVIVCKIRSIIKITIEHYHFDFVAMKTVHNLNIDSIKHIETESKKLSNDFAITGITCNKCENIGKIIVENSF